MPIRLYYFAGIQTDRMNYVFLFLSCIALVSHTSCNPAKQSKEEQDDPAQKEKLSLAAYADSLKTMNRNTPAVIEHALRLFDRLAPADSTGADSAAAALMGLVSDVAAKENDRLWQDTADYSALVDADTPILTEKQKAFLSELHRNKMKPVSDGEGSIYLVPVYESILAGIQSKTSMPVDKYLDLVAKEDTTPVFLDAGLAIELTELADRLVLSEQLLSQRLPQRFQTEAERLNAFYTHALVSGADNSPSIEYDNKVLNPEFKKGYDYLLVKFPYTKAAARIKEWLAVIASGDQTKIEAYRQTLE